MVVYRSPNGMIYAAEGMIAKEMAKKCARDGRWREVPGTCRDGYPVVMDKVVVAESCGNVYVGDNENNVIPLEECSERMRRAVCEFLVRAGV